MSQKRIALIIPHTDVTLETDLKTFLPSNFIIHTQRIWLEEVGEEAEKKMVDVDLPTGVEYLKGITQFDGAIFGCTSASAVYGKSGLNRLESYLSDSFNSPAISAMGAILKKIHACDVKRLGLITPYTEEVNKFMIQSMDEFGISITYDVGMGIVDDCKISQVEPDAIVELVMKHTKELKEACDMVLISCTNLRSMEVREQLESILDMETITSNYCICKWIQESII